MPAPAAAASPRAYPPPRSDQACPKCSADLILVTVKIVDQPVSMLYCGVCEYGRWRSKGESVALTDAMDALRRPLPKVARRRRRPASRIPDDEELLAAVRGPVASWQNLMPP